MQEAAALRYYDVGFIAFYHCLHDENQLDSYGIDREKWPLIKRAWQKRNPDKSEEFSVMKEIERERIRMDNLSLILFRYRLDPDSCEELLKRYRINPNNAVEDLLKKIERQKTLLRKRTGALKKRIKLREQQSEKEKDEEFSIESMFKCLASLESHMNVGPYMEFPLYRYEAIQKTLKDGRKGQN